MASETHVDVSVRIDDEAATQLNRLAEMADVSRDQAVSVLFALWCVHNLPEVNPEP